MLVKIKGNPIISDWPSVSDGEVCDLPDYLALHLMEIDCAAPMENKIVPPAIVEKKSTAVTSASFSLPAAQVSQKSKSKKQGNIKPSQSTTTTR